MLTPFISRLTLCSLLPNISVSSTVLTLISNVGQLQEVLNGWDEGAIEQQSDDFMKVQLNKLVHYWEQTGTLQLAGVVDHASIATRNAKMKHSRLHSVDKKKC